MRRSDGLLFGRPTPGGEIDVDLELGGLGPELGEWNFQTWSLHTEHHVHHFRGNWKSAWDTFCENYHFAFLHATTIKDRLISRRQAIDAYGAHIRMVTALKTIEEMRRLPKEEWNPQPNLSIQYRLFPTVNLSVYPDKLEVHWIYPGRAPDEGYGIHPVYVPKEPETDEELKRLDEIIRFGCENVVQAEDFWVTGQTVPGMRAPGRIDHVVYGRHEPAVQHFHNCYREKLAAAEAGASARADERAEASVILSGSR